MRLSEHIVTAFIWWAHHNGIYQSFFFVHFAVIFNERTRPIEMHCTCTIFTRIAYESASPHKRLRSDRFNTSFQMLASICIFKNKSSALRSFSTYRGYCVLFYDFHSSFLFCIPRIVIHSIQFQFNSFQFSRFILNENIYVTKSSFFSCDNQISI